MTVGPPQDEGGDPRISHALVVGLSCAFDHGAASPLEDFYDPLLVDALRAHLISEEPPMWVIDAPLQTEPFAGDEVVGWIRPFIEHVEERTGAEAPWEPFNTKNALHQPPERCWVESSDPVGGGPAEKLAGLQAFLRLSSGGGKTFMDKGHRFAVKRYPHAGVPDGAEGVGAGGAEFYAAEAQHVDRLQRCPDLPQPEEGEAKLYGEPTHFTLVVGFDEATGGTFFPHGRLLPGLEALPDGVSQGARGGVLVQSRRGRALLWSNHRGAVDPAGGAVLPLRSSLHQSVLSRAAGDSPREPRRVCIFGWAQEGRKWERSGFHECLEYEPPKVRAEFFGRTLLQELEGWEDGQRAREVKFHLKDAEVQREIKEGLANDTLNEATRNWLSDYGYEDKSEIFQLMIDQMGDGRYNWSFMTLGGNVKYNFRVPHKSIKVGDLVTRVKENFPCKDGHVVSRVEALDHLTRKKITNQKRLIQQGEQCVIVVKTTEMSLSKIGVTIGTQTASAGSQAAAPSTAAGSGGYPPSTATGSGSGLLVGRTKSEAAPSARRPHEEDVARRTSNPSSSHDQAFVAVDRTARLVRAGTENFTSKHHEADEDEDEAETNNVSSNSNTAAVGASSSQGPRPAGAEASPKKAGGVGSWASGAASSARAAMSRLRPSSGGGSGGK